MSISALVTRRTHQAHVTVTGEVDVFNAVQVRAQLNDLLGQGCRDFAVDVAEVTFIDAAGLGAFVHLHNSTIQRGGTLRFVAVSPAFRRACDLADLSPAFGLAALPEVATYDMA